MTTPSTDALHPPQGATRLILQPDERTTFTANRETDCRIALCRGLKEYVEQLSKIAIGGREVYCKRVFEQWAEAEVPARFPSAAIYSTSSCDYDASRFTPGVNPAHRLTMPDGRYLMQMAEFVAELSVDVWCTDPIERASIAIMLEDAFNPVDWMYGFRLLLPHYFNVRASFEMKAQTYIDTEEEAKRRHRRVVFTLEGRCPLIRLASFPMAIPQHHLDVVESINASDP